MEETTKYLIVHKCPNVFCDHGCNNGEKPQVINASELMDYLHPTHGVLTGVSAIIRNDLSCQDNNYLRVAFITPEGVYTKTPKEIPHPDTVHYVKPNDELLWYSRVLGEGTIIYCMSPPCAASIVEQNVAKAFREVLSQFSIIVCGCLDTLPNGSKVHYANCHQGLGKYKKINVSGDLKLLRSFGGEFAKVLPRDSNNNPPWILSIVDHDGPRRVESRLFNKALRTFATCR
jgi:hypothetical protein